MLQNSTTSWLACDGIGRWKKVQASSKRARQVWPLFYDRFYPSSALWVRSNGSGARVRMNLRFATVIFLVMCLATGCAGPHFDITREIGLLPPQDDRSDFYDDAKDRCETYDLSNRLNVQCTEYWEALLYAQDYRSYAEARAMINKNVIYIAGIVALGSVAALAGFAAFDAVSSDAYKIIPIASGFAAGALGFSQNDAKYEAYQAAASAIHAAIDDAQVMVRAGGAPNYVDATARLRTGVRNAKDALNRVLADITKFQAKNTAEQFSLAQRGIEEKELKAYTVVSARPDKEIDPKNIIATLNTSPDPQVLSVGEIRLKLTDPSNNTVHALSILSLKGTEISAAIPMDLQDRGSKSYMIEILARYGRYALSEGGAIQLTYSKIRLDVAVSGSGKVSYPNPNPGNGTTKITCTAHPPCQQSRPPRGVAVEFTPEPSEPNAEQKEIKWSGDAEACGITKGRASCSVTLATDAKIGVEFK
jgi:hypothetical protein